MNKLTKDKKLKKIDIIPLFPVFERCTSDFTDLPLYIVELCDPLNNYYAINDSYSDITQPGLFPRQ